MTKQATAPEAKEPTMAELMALVVSLQKQVAAGQAAAPATGVTAEDFADDVAAAEKAGFKPQVVPSLQKGASVALRTDY